MQRGVVIGCFEEGPGFVVPAAGLRMTVTPPLACAAATASSDVSRYGAAVNEST